MMDLRVVALLLLALLLFLSAAIVLLLSRASVYGKPGEKKKKHEGASSHESLEEEERAVGGSRGSRRERAGSSRMRQRRNRGRDAGAQSVSDRQVDMEEVEVGDNLHEEEREEGEEIEEGEAGGREMSRKEQKRKEKEAKKQAEQAARELREGKADRYAEKQRSKEEERERAQKEKAKEEADFQARRALEAEAELEKWKDMFSVEVEGTVESDVQEESQGLLGEFVDYIKSHKCVALEDIAAEFRLRAQDVVNRVLALEEMGRISGIMDDRGKFIFVSMEEMKAVAEYIRKAGRVNISHLASKSNEFIDLEPKAASSTADEGLAWLDDVPQ